MLMQPVKNIFIAPGQCTILLLLLEIYNPIALYDIPVPRLAEPGPAGGTVQPPPCGQRGTQPIGHDIGNLCGSLGHTGLMEFIGDAVAERAQDTVEGDLS